MTDEIFTITIHLKARKTHAESNVFINALSGRARVQLSEPSMDDTMPDNERLAWKLREETGAEKVVLTYSAL